jgi:AcrR family transcriptional regulator
MSKPAARPPLQERVASAILEAAARVLAARGEQASMHDVAAAAGLARATVYRYFPNRQALLDEVAEVAVLDAGARLAAARVDQVPVEEGVRRAVRALVEVGDPFLVLARERVRPDPDELERAIAAPLRRMFERGQREGELRDDVPGPWLGESLMALVVAVLSSPPALGREDLIAAISSIFMDGTRARP